MSLRGCPQEDMVDPSPRPVLRVLGDADALGYLIRGGEADAMDFLSQCVGVLLHRLDCQIAVRLEDADRPPSADPVAMEKEHDLPDLHPLLPGSGDPFTALWADAVYGLQVGRVVADDAQHLCAEVSDQLLRQDRSN